MRRTRAKVQEAPPLRKYGLVRVVIRQSPPPSVKTTARVVLHAQPGQAMRVALLPLPSHHFRRGLGSKFHEQTAEHFLVLALATAV